MHLPAYDVPLQDIDLLDYGHRIIETMNAPIGDGIAVVAARQRGVFFPTAVCAVCESIFTVVGVPAQQRKFCSNRCREYFATRSPEARERQKRYRESRAHVANMHDPIASLAALAPSARIVVERRHWDGQFVLSLSSKDLPRGSHGVPRSYRIRTETADEAMVRVAQLVLRRLFIYGLVKEEAA